MAKNLITKRALIDHANTVVVASAGIAAFILIFSLVASKTLVSQAAYQNRVITAKKHALKQLENDVTATNTLKTHYDDFTNNNPNVLKGNATGNGAQDGNNRDIILHALPSSYDFPALATSLEKIMTGQSGITISSISGTDDAAAQATNTSSTTPEPVAMPFQLSVSGDYASIQALIGQFEHSIRPFQIQTLSISGDQSKLSVNIGAQTFYQPAKLFNTTNTTVIK